MIELPGKHNTAKVFTDNISQKTISQIIQFCNLDFLKDSKIRIMPDTHAGNDCVIGTTMTLPNHKVIPNLVGHDIGCGMFVVKLKEKDIDLEMLDKVIREYVPAGAKVHDKYHKYVKYVHLDKLKCKSAVGIDKSLKAMGTLGGGNHFIEVNKDSEGNLYLVIHTGSRTLGKYICKHYQELGYRKLTDNREQREAIINKFKTEGKEQLINNELKKLPKVNIPKNLAYVEGKDFDDYVHDMQLTQFFANMNREAIADTIIDKMGLTEISSFHTIHNYIEDNSTTNSEYKYVLRKGAISSRLDEIVLIPINMRDGSILAKGKGNPDWNYSAPHGAGRVFSRSQAKEIISLEEFQESMKDVFTTSVNQNTIDESPMVYKPMEEILGNITEAVDVIDILKPIYNFKASDLDGLDFVQAKIAERKKRKLEREQNEGKN